MSESKYSQPYCVVQNCKMSIFNKPLGVTFHSLPTNNEMKTRWQSILKSRCLYIDWAKSRICSKHFEHKCFDAQRKLKDTAIPTMFSTGEFSTQNVINSSNQKTYQGIPKTKIDHLLNVMNQSDLQTDVKQTYQSVRMPDSFPKYVDDNLKCVPNTPTEIQLCLLLKKQDYLITRLTQQVLQSKKHVEVLQNNMEETRLEKREMEQNLENYKYIAKCLQEKQASLEEQIEILTAVESR